MSQVWFGVRGIGSKANLGRRSFGCMDCWLNLGLAEPFCRVRLIFTVGLGWVGRSSWCVQGSVGWVGL